MDDNLDYEEIVNEMAEADSDEFISNGLPKHAAILYRVFFERAREEVLIFCKNLDRLVFGSDQMVEALDSAALRGVAIKVVTQTTPDDGNPFADRLQQLATERPGQVIYRPIPPNPQTEGQVHVSRMRTNACVVDGKAWRWEPDCERINATACMNQPKMARSIHGFIEAIFGVAA